MKFDLRNILIKITALFLMGAILGLIVNRVINTHTHISENGTIVTHAHPYNKQKSEGPVKTHHHGSMDFSFLDHFDLLFLLSILSLSSLLFVNKNNYKAFHLIPFKSRHSRDYTGRAPPINNYH